jgi:hypothetical protein
VELFPVKEREYGSNVNHSNKHQNYIFNTNIVIGGSFSFRTMPIGSDIDKQYTQLFVLSVVSSHSFF